MRGLLWVSVLLMGLWSGYWFIGKTAVDRAAIGFFAMAPAQGLEAEHKGLSVAGFPNRFDLTVTEPSLADRKSGFGWQAPFLQIFSLSYKPWHIIAAFAPEQMVMTPYENLSISSEKLQASVVVEPNANLTFDRTTLIGSDLGIASTLGWAFKADDLRFATRQDPSRENVHQIGLDLLELTPDPSLSRLLPDLPARIEKLHIDVFMGFSAPIDRFAGQSRPQVELLEIREGSLGWGDLAVFVKGDLPIVAGAPEGRVDLRIEGWRKLLPLIEQSGAIKAEVLPTVERMLETLALQSGNAEVLEMPLIFAGGQMRLGPLPLGPAPRF